MSYHQNPKSLKKQICRKHSTASLCQENLGKQKPLVHPSQCHSVQSQILLDRHVEKAAHIPESFIGSRIYCLLRNSVDTQPGGLS